MYANLINMADETLAANRTLRQQTADLRARTIAVMLRYRRHRFRLLIGGSDRSGEDEHICEVCGGAIKRGAGRFRVGKGEYHPDCYRFWLIAPLAHQDDAVE